MDLIVKDSTFAGVGLPIFRPEGAWMKNKLREILRRKLLLRGYQEVESPAIGRLALFKTSGHYPYYSDSMFALIPESEEDYTFEHYALKPMNCPFHVGVYKDEPRSYRDLPVRYFEFGKVYRMEDSGSVNGLLRSRAFEQDDGHIFCTDLQISEEVQDIINLAQDIFSVFNLHPKARLSVRDERTPSKYIGSDSLWVHAENELRIALEDNKLEYTREAGAAFYGPKIDFVVNDKLGREWQLGTIQLDFNLPEKFELAYKNSQNGESRPVMIHRAILGSLERFLGFLLSEDSIPDAIHPKLYALVPVGDSQPVVDYAKVLEQLLISQGNSCKIFSREEPLKARIKRAKEEGYRNVAVFGPAEVGWEPAGYQVKINNQSVWL